jgi:hypothetical protein
MQKHVQRKVLDTPSLQPKKRPTRQDLFLEVMKEGKIVKKKAMSEQAVYFLSGAHTFLRSSLQNRDCAELIGPRPPHISLATTLNFSDRGRFGIHSFYGRLVKAFQAPFLSCTQSSAAAGDLATLSLFLSFSLCLSFSFSLSLSLSLPLSFLFSLYLSLSLFLSL